MSEPSGPYRHNDPESQLWNLHHVMDYNSIGQPAMRIVNTSIQSTKDGRVDAFGRQRVAEPFTLFDSTQRYSNRSDQWETELVGSASSTYNINQSLTELTVTTANGDRATRETKRVFAYQPGKSLQMIASFVFDEGQTGLVQRVGLFNARNGIYVSSKNGTIYLVKRTYVNGTVEETEVAQSDWNVDKLDGTTVSGINLDFTKAQILFMDLEWLGAGQVRTGFIVDGNFFLAHAFQHTNIIESTYITSATLPVRYEIENIADTVASSSMKQICATVISEGGYQIRGRPHAAGCPVTAPRDLTVAGTFYPLVSVRLGADFLDAVAVLKNIHVLGVGNNSRIQYALFANSTITGGTWTSDTGSLVEYNITATAMSGGEMFTSGYIGVSVQAGQAISLDANELRFQLERNGLANTSITYTLAAAGGANGDDALGSIDWEELF